MGLGFGIHSLNMLMRTAAQFCQFLAVYPNPCDEPRRSKLKAASEVHGRYRLTHEIFNQKRVEKAGTHRSRNAVKRLGIEAEKTLLKGKYEGTLDTLRSIDGEGQHPTTLRIAGEATWAKAKDTRSKSDFRKAASLFRDSMKGNSKDKRTSTQYNNLLNEMQDARISETVFPRLVRDGTPTLSWRVCIWSRFVVDPCGSIGSQRPESRW